MADVTSHHAMATTNDDMSILRVVREEIRAATSTDALHTYFEAMRGWLRGRRSLADFDERAQQIVPVELHTKFLVALVAVFDPSRRSFTRSSSTPATISSISSTKNGANSRSTLLNYDGAESSGQSATASESRHLTSLTAWTELQGRTAAGWLPDCQLIHAWALVTALADNLPPAEEAAKADEATVSGASSDIPLESVDEDVAAIVFDHVQTSVANILEAVLKMSRSFLCTDTGFAHSYGVQKLHLSNTSGIQNSASTQTLRCILPTKTPICAEDVLDCLDLEPNPERSGGLLPHMTLKSRLIKRLENIASTNGTPPPAAAPSASTETVS